MPFYAYIIQSEIDGSLYKGHADDVESRLKAHNAGKTRSIKMKIPFKLIYSERFETRPEAIARERYFKSGAGRRWIKKNILKDNF